ncbi:MAG: DUF488 family protein [Acidobacteriota bacterium]|nr:DUF488 family protein [Acidobacteriota bacterium]
MDIALKHAVLDAAEEDGARVLVDRMLPDGLSEQEMTLRGWLAPLGPSRELAVWYEARPAQWLLFRKKYLAELDKDEAIEALSLLAELTAEEKRVTLVTASGDPEKSHAAVLRDLFSGARKPPATTGPARAASAGRNRARRPR